ncbi:MAG: TetR/AcrR family transcriptional regulator [Bacteroidetes bacterium]|nr:TetR/AcrR family transcriptional regulator [Bacteroidota bacterium]
MAKHENEETRKQQILTAAAKCIARYGYYTTSVDIIAKEAKLSKGAIYWYYKSKEEVFVALSEWRWKQNVEYMEALEAKSTTFREFLNTMVEATSQFILSVTYELRTIHELNALATENAELRRVLVGNDLAMHKIFVRVLKRFVKSGELRKNIKPDEAATYMRCVVDGFAIHAGRENAPLLAKTMKTAFLSFYLDLKA